MTTEPEFTLDWPGRYAEEFAYSGDLCLIVAEFEIHRLGGFYQTSPAVCAEHIVPAPGTGLEEGK